MNLPPMQPAAFLANVWFANLHWGVPALAAALLVAGLMRWGYRVGPGGPYGVLCACCKGLGCAALLLCLLEPLWSRQRVRPGANLFAILADNSQGMQIRDSGSDQSRGDILRSLLDDTTGSWQNDLANHFELRRFTFDARLQDAHHGFTLPFDGPASALGGALRSVKARFEGRPLAGVLLLTDGIATDRSIVTEALSGMPPVYPVVIGRDAPVRDVAITRTQVSRTAFEDAPITVQVDVSAHVSPGESIYARLEDARGARVQEQTQSAPDQDSRLTFRFQFRPDEPGLTFYRLHTGLTGIHDAAEADTREATLLNNNRIVPVDLGQGPFRILYVSGRPNWEYKFLNRALRDDDQLRMVALIRIALREPKFEFRGRAGETSNPLFRGFGDQSREETERYDQPVLTRLNTRDERELQGGFPRSAEELFAYDAVVIDDLEADFFDADQSLLLQRFVSQRGGGALMLGGTETFGQGGYHDSPIGDMLPVYLERSPALTPSGPVTWELAREGWLQAWVRLRDNQADEYLRLARMPQFEILNPVRDVKPGASVLATATDAESGTFPALVTQRFGRGRSAALLVGDLWRWGMQGPEVRADLDKSWRQLLRWLVSDVPQRVELVVEDAPASAPGGVLLQVRARDASFQPLDDASLHLQVHPVLTDGPSATNTAVHLQLDPSLDEPGLYQTAFIPRHSGGYRATVTVTNASGEHVGHAQAGWSADLAADEFRTLRPDLPLLEEIARATGGEVIAPDQLAELTRSLPVRAAPVMEPWITPLWHTPAMFVFALTCFITEWGLRRWRGSP